MSNTKRSFETHISVCKRAKLYQQLPRYWWFKADCLRTQCWKQLTKRFIDQQNSFTVSQLPRREGMEFLYLTISIARSSQDIYSEGWKKSSPTLASIILARTSMHILKTSAGFLTHKTSTRSLISVTIFKTVLCFLSHWTEAPCTSGA